MSRVMIIEVFMCWLPGYKVFRSDYRLDECHVEVLHPLVNKNPEPVVWG